MVCARDLAGSCTPVVRLAASPLDVSLFVDENGTCGSDSGGEVVVRPQIDCFNEAVGEWEPLLEPALYAIVPLFECY